MGSLTLTDPVNGTTADASLIATNNAAIKTVVNGGLDNSNIAADAAIAPSKFASFPNNSSKVLLGDGTWGTGPGMQLIWDSVDAAVTLPAASITTPTLPGTFKHLHVVVNGRTSDTTTGGSGGFSQVLLRVNADTGSNYDMEWSDATSSSTSATGSEGGTSARVGQIANAEAPASHAGGLIVDAFDYASTTFFKNFVTHGGMRYGTSSNVQTAVSYQQWRSASAITSLTFLLSAGNWVAGSRITVYGKA